MRYLFIITFLIFISCHNHKNTFNDWFDLNLKGDPKTVSEITIFSLIDSAFPKINLSIRDYSFIHEYYFNSDGVLIKEYLNVSPRSEGKWIEYKKFVNYADSIIIDGQFSGSGGGSFKERRLLNKTGLIVRKIVLRDTISYQRNHQDRIQIKDEHLIGIDSPMKRETIFTYNNNGDIETETINETSFYDSVKTQMYETENQYKYIYDHANNWIIKICITDSIIQSITQRKIVY